MSDIDHANGQMFLLSLKHKML